MKRKERVQEVAVFLLVALLMSSLIGDWLFLAILFIPGIFLLFDEEVEEER